MKMKTFVFVSVLCGVVCLSVAKDSAPEVQFYTRSPAHYGVRNTLICHLSGFQPPEIDFQMMADGLEMPSDISDLIFEYEWQYHLTRIVSFTPEPGVKYTCSVTHLGKTAKYTWDLSNDK